MKIAMVSMNAGPPACPGDVDAGAQSVIVDGLARAFVTLGHRITVYTRRSDPALPLCMTTAAGVHIDRIDAEADETGTGAICARLAAEWHVDPPDVVHAYSWMSGKAAIAAARPYGIPVVQTFLGLGRAKVRRDDDESALIRGAARIVAMSSADVFALLRMGANPGAIKLIPCGVDLERFAPSPPATGPSREPLRIATLGRLCCDEGVGDVIEALRFVPGVELFVGGGNSPVCADPDARALAALAQTHGVATRVTLRGRIERSDAAAFLRAADVVVCAPRYESIGTVALEAMACGVPVIASAVGGLADIVADGMTGIQIPPHAPRQLAYAIESLASNRLRRERFGRLGFERTAARYGWLRIASETFEVYRSVAAHNAAITGTGAG